ncbi:MAG: hypothetical protein PF448_07490 [Bacteroidales bacterium]|jgi:hypothetical protein|nr:hypothetical protein [Bacteroidales bacterium]
MKIYKFRILSSENKDFVRDIEIPDEKRFYDLHMGIQAACDFDFSQMTSFFLSNQAWEKETEISMLEMDEDPDQEEKPHYMKDVRLKDLITKANQRLLYLFDFFSVRMMFIELVEIRTMTPKEAKLNYPICTFAEGKAPEMQIIDDVMNMEDLLPDDFDEFDDDLSEDFENIDDYDL